MILAFLATAAGGFAFGVLVAVLLLSAKEDELLEARAQRLWAEMEREW